MTIKTLKKYQYAPPKNGYPEWNNNPEIFQLNRRNAHATLMPYETLEEALQGNRNASSYYCCLNGDWKEDIKPPFAPTKYNPVGQYRTSFTIPKGWEGQPVYFHFEGVESAFYVWVNGEMVGYSEDTFTPPEFDVTPYLIDGENQLAVEVYRWCDASWLAEV
ncbi:hypothetical protein QFZ31_004621 [Neobacillus niacini]|nr:hypothetical protein [Neobacillus niacini]